jgi:hypothetical protein
MVFLFNAPGTYAQICASPATVIYGLTANGEIYPITVSNASTGTVVKNSTYSGNSASRANGLAYNSTNGKFYYFKRNVGTSPEEFVVYDPGTVTVTVLSSSTCNTEIHTGCISANGLYYFTIDINANLNCYDIVNNTWTKITSSFTDQYTNNVSTVIQNQNAGDIAFDGNGNLWIVTSNSSSYGVYMLPAPMPLTPVAGVAVTMIVNPSSVTPTGNIIAGIAFNPSGQIFMSTKYDDLLYRLENNLSLTYMGKFTVSDVGNDLTSCAFPLGVLPVTWISFTASLLKSDEVELNWQFSKKNNSGFYVQHCTDGINWKELSFIETENNNLETGKYSYSHKNPATGKNYYRIKTRDESGKENYTQIKMLMVKLPGASITIWPNPASSIVNIAADNYTTTKVRIFDLAGKLQLDQLMQTAETSLNISSLKPGIYLLNMTTQDGVSHNQKLIKK